MAFNAPMSGFLAAVRLVNEPSESDTSCCWSSHVTMLALPLDKRTGLGHQEVELTKKEEKRKVRREQKLAAHARWPRANDSAT